MCSLYYCVTRCLNCRRWALILMEVCVCGGASSPKTPSVRILGALFVSNGGTDVPDLTPVRSGIGRTEHVVPYPGENPALSA